MAVIKFIKNLFIIIIILSVISYDVFNVIFE